MKRIYTMYGVLAEEHDEALEFHKRTLQLLRDLSVGTVAPSQLRVTENGWSVAPPEPTRTPDNDA